MLCHRQPSFGCLVYLHLWLTKTHSVSIPTSRSEAAHPHLLPEGSIPLWHHIWGPLCPSCPPAAHSTQCSTVASHKTPLVHLSLARCTQRCQQWCRTAQRMTSRHHGSSRTMHCRWHLCSYPGCAIEVLQNLSNVPLVCVGSVGLERFRTSPQAASVLMLPTRYVHLAGLHHLISSSSS